MNKLQLVVFVTLVLVLIAGAYLLGVKKPKPEPELEFSAPKNLEEIMALDTEFDRQQSDLANRIDEIKNRVETAKLNLNIEKFDDEAHSTEIADSLKELNGRLLDTQNDTTTSSVAFPPDSAAGKLQRQAKTESGIPVSVLRNYENETGISAEEVEALMRRTK